MKWLADNGWLAAMKRTDPKEDPMIVFAAFRAQNIRNALHRSRFTHEEFC